MAAKYTKRADGRYCTTVVTGYTKEGRPKRKSVYGKTIKELEKNKREFMNLYEKGVAVDTQNITLAEFAEDWMNDRKDSVARSTYFSYKSTIKHIKESDLARMKITDIKPYNLNRFLETFKKQGQTRAAKTMLCRLKAMFNLAVSQDIIYKNPCANMSVKYESKHKRTLTELEKRRIEKCNLGSREKAFIYTLRYTGARRGEVLALTKDDIDFKNKTVTINKKISDNAGRPTVDDKMKTNAGARIMPLFDPLASVLDDYIASINTPYLFYTKNNTPMGACNVSNLMSNLRAKIGLPDDVTPHTFRHTFITECYEAGIDVARLQKWVGHADIQTTLGIYTHLSSERVLDGSDMNEFYVVKMSSNAKKQKTKIVEMQ